VARRPDLVRPEAQYGPLHTLTLDRDHGVFNTVLVPHAGAEPAEVSVTRHEQELTIDHGHTVDRVSPCRWVRTRRATGDPLSETLSWATGWQVRELSDRNRPLFRSAAAVDVEATVLAEGLQLAVTASSRCAIRVRVGQGSQVRLDAVPVTAISDEDGWAELTLPYAGRWIVDGASHD
jgi:hypothetical protein